MSDPELLIRLDPKLAPQCRRVDQILRATLEVRGWPIPRRVIKEWFDEGLVQTLEGRRLEPASASEGLRELNILTHEYPAWKLLFESKELPKAKQVLLKPVFEDEHYLIVVKPAGLPTVPHSPLEIESAVHQAVTFRPHLPLITDDPQGLLGRSLLHRLDTGTSGLLVFAQTREAFKFLRDQWSTDITQKIYRFRAVAGASESGVRSLPRLGKIELGAESDPKSSRRMRIARENSRREQESKVLPMRSEILDVWHAQAGAIEGLIRIRTGVRHQVRLTLAHLGHPLLGDETYGGPRAARLYLHAERLILPHPTKQLIETTAPLPPDWGIVR